MPTERILKRAAAVRAWKQLPTATLKEIAEEASCSLKVAQRWKPAANGDISLQDAPRSGRKRKLSTPQLDLAASLASNPAIHGSANVAAAMKTQAGVDVGASTVRRNFREAAMVFAYPKIETAMTRKQKLDRVQWAQKLQAQNYAWSRVMMTDSKVFGLQLTVAKRGRKEWQKKGQRITQERVRGTKSVHVYVGLSKHGATPLLPVTSTGGPKNTRYRNKRTGQMHRGVGAEEYSQKVLPWFQQQGQKLFNLSGRFAHSWHFQQDGAKPHTAKESKEQLEQLWGSKRLLTWPANSPDLSPVENFWALLSDQLCGKRGDIKTLDQLEGELQKLCKACDKQTFEKYMKGMPNRLAQVIAMKGERIGK